jgi:hypothetical protein
MCQFGRLNIMQETVMKKIGNKGEKSSFVYHLKNNFNTFLKLCVSSLSGVYLQKVRPY